MSQGGLFLPLLHTCVEQIAPAGAINGLVQAVLKLTVPGVPDFFQGTEFWDFSLVDPDNRRPVDYEQRLEALCSDMNPVDLLRDWTNGRVKQAIIRRILAFRRAMPGLFAAGDYIPLSAVGARAAHVVAFLRQQHGNALMVVLPVCIAHDVVCGQGLRLSSAAYGDTVVKLPETHFGRRWRSILADETVDLDGDLPLNRVFNGVPLAVLSRVDSA
jgi:(1->4)-alpha-D-glucan 1-alpha-D-glucosylmutase